MNMTVPVTNNHINPVDSFALHGLRRLDTLPELFTGTRVELVGVIRNGLITSRNHRAFLVIKEPRPLGLKMLDNPDLHIIEGEA